MIGGAGRVPVVAVVGLVAVVALVVGTSSSPEGGHLPPAPQPHAVGHHRVEAVRRGVGRIGGILGVAYVVKNIDYYSVNRVFD